MNQSVTFVDLRVDGKKYPVEIADVTGDMAMALRDDLGVTPGELVAKVVTKSCEAPELVALMVLSLWLRDKPADHRWLLRHFRLDAEVDYTSPALEARAKAAAKS